MSISPATAGMPRATYKPSLLASIAIVCGTGITIFLVVGIVGFLLGEDEDKCSRQAELEYFQAVERELGKMSPVIKELSALAGDAANPQLLSFLDDDWRAREEAALDSLESIADNILELDAPTSLASASEPLEEAIRLTKAAVEDYRTALDTQDPEDILAGNRKLDSALPKQDQFVEATETYQPCEYW